MTLIYFQPVSTTAEGWERRGRGQSMIGTAGCIHQAHHTSGNGEIQMLVKRCSYLTYKSTMVWIQRWDHVASENNL